MNTWIALLDCNNFFVSCERLFRPDLRTVPTMVLSSNDGCVVARSQEIKDMGIPMGIPYFKIKDIIKDKKTAVFSSNFTHYREVSRRVFEVMRQEVAMVEQYSVDEAFCVLRGTDGEVVERAAALREAVQQRVGIPVSVGVAGTKTRAKYANSMAKKGEGVQLVNDTDWVTLAPTIPLSEIWGIGGRLAVRFRELGLHNVAELCAADTARIGRLFGVGGVRLQRELQGTAVFPVEQRRALQKTIMSSRSFKAATTELSVLEDAVAYHIRQATADLRQMGCQATTLRVMIRPSRHGDYMLRGGSAEVGLVAPTNDTRVFLGEAMRLVRQLFEAEVPYKKAGIVLGGISPTELTQASLFTEVGGTAVALMPVLDAINSRWGKETLRIGDRMRAGEWQVKRAFTSPRYTTAWSELPVVNAQS